jgi:hypothetical protein
VKCEHRALFGNQFFINTCYDPEVAERGFINEFQEAKARIWRKRIYWGRAKYIFRCYDSYRDVTASKMMGISEGDPASVKERILSANPTLRRFYHERKLYD